MAGRRGKIMNISARNCLKGTIKSITRGPVMAEIVLDIGNGVQVTSVITAKAADNLGLKEGKEAYAVMKSTEVMIAVD
ncbi:molybdopterin-binding protein [Methanospirillum sp.]|jgi:molybdopterin-binding protein|uniref:TOBE domain-containing protein n=2 Tax=Methanospirillum sp. TaxID=45200 RepID=UPI002D1FAEF1|nr:molybdopterin-binding protein [Methanospirillum sp.]